MRRMSGIVTGALALTMLVVPAAWAADGGAVDSGAALPDTGTPTCAANPCQPTGCGVLCYENANEKNPALGAALRWKVAEIPFKYNVSKLPTSLNKAAVIAEIKKAFEAWNDIPCSTLKFKDGGEQTTLVTKVDGSIFVYWDADPTYVQGGTWTYGNALYIAAPIGMTGTYMDPEIKAGVIGLNATVGNPKFKYDWSIGVAAGKYDIKSTIMRLIPQTIGFSWGYFNGVNMSIPIMPGYGLNALCEQHKTGAQFVYPAGGDCVKPAVTFCQLSTYTNDAGKPIVDGGGYFPGPDSTIHEGGAPGWDAYVNPTGDGGNKGDAAGDGSKLPAPEDDGCCRVSHARGESLPYLALLGFALLLTLGRRRRR